MLVRDGRPGQERPGGQAGPTAGAFGFSLARSARGDEGRLGRTDSQRAPRHAVHQHASAACAMMVCYKPRLLGPYGPEGSRTVVVVGGGMGCPAHRRRRRPEWLRPRRRRRRRHRRRELDPAPAAAAGTRTQALAATWRASHKSQITNGGRHTNHKSQITACRGASTRHDATKRCHEMTIPGCLDPRIGRRPPAASKHRSHTECMPGTYHATSDGPALRT
jgi:hypothetical protein